MVLILYAALAGIPGVLAYLQENNIIVQSYGVSCGSCHVDPGANTPEKTNLTGTANQKELKPNTSCKSWKCYVENAMIILSEFSAT